VRCHVRHGLRLNPASARQWAHDGWTPLHLASYFGHRETVEILLDAGADRSLRSGDGQTAREIASQHGRHEVARLLSP
jgi:oxysterol-binding protein-related protein 1/2